MTTDQGELMLRILQSLQGDMATLKADLTAARSELGDLRTEVGADIAETRSELRSENDLVRAEVRLIGQKIDRVDRENGKHLELSTRTADVVNKAYAAVTALDRRLKVVEDR